MMNRQKRYYVSESEVAEFLDKITRIQSKNRTFENVEVKKYKGKKYGPDTKVIIVG